MALSKKYLGNTGLQVSELALGTWRFGGGRSEDGGISQSEANRLLDTFANNGGTFIDTANRYGSGRSEKWIGEWLNDHDRSEFVLASKIGRPTLQRENLSRRHLRYELEEILDRLDTDYLDILYAHRLDDDTSPEEYLRTYAAFVDAGLVDHIGVSTRFPDAWKVARANEIAKQRGFVPFSITQPQYNLIRRRVEKNYLEMCREYGLGVVPFNPLAEGFLTAKYARDSAPPENSRAAAETEMVNRYFQEAAFDVVDRVCAVADEVGATPAQVSIAWLLHQEIVTAPIIGVRTTDQLEENVGATALNLSHEQLDRLENPQ